VIGALREGDEIVRNGRTGAFTFNLAAIKNHSIAVAAHAVERLELRPDGVAVETCPGGHVDEAARKRCEQAVALEVRRLAAKAGRERARIDRQLDACLRSMDESATAQHLIRVAVNQAAVRRLTDVSVTPRRLRRQLGLATAGEPPHP
jgi:hypothetical protein